MKKDPTARFTDRVADYAKYRPSYPSALVGILRERLGLARAWTVADLGSGTGMSSEPFLDAGCRVVGVEPNAAMRAAAERLLGARPNFASVGGRAEATGLDELSIDLVVSGQAFHWFDRAAARDEALRILRPPKRALLMWNDWRPDYSPFLRDYDELLRSRMPERSEADHRDLGPRDFDAFFGEGKWEKVSVPNPKRQDLESLKGRMLSASYAPKEGDPGYAETIAGLESIFARHQRGGEVEFAYATELYFGEMSE
jgi:SAM-dependent methyltransferase